MGETPPFRIGVVSGATSGPGWQSLVRRAEELGYSTVFLSDHLDATGKHVSNMAPMPALAAAAASTRSISLGTTVLNQDLRNPAVLAREAATLQMLSGGRLELGIGAGWNEQEYRWAGLAYDPASVRISRLGEYLEIVRALLGAGEVRFHGKYFDIDGMPAWPGDGVSAPRIMVGGSGPRTLQVAASCADIVNINLVGRPDASWQAMDSKLALVREAAASRLDEIELSAMIIKAVVSNGGRREALTGELARREAAGQPLPTAGQNVDGLLHSTAWLIGTADQIAEELVARRQRWGIAYYAISYWDLEAFAPVIRLLQGA